MQDKAYKDIADEAFSRGESFPQFMYDYMILSYGLKTIAVK